MLAVCCLQGSLAFIMVKREMGENVPSKRRGALDMPMEELEIGSGTVCT